LISGRIKLESLKRSTLQGPKPTSLKHYFYLHFDISKSVQSINSPCMNALLIHRPEYFINDHNSLHMITMNLYTIWNCKIRAKYSSTDSSSFMPRISNYLRRFCYCAPDISCAWTPKLCPL